MPPLRTVYAIPCDRDWAGRARAELADDVTRPAAHQVDDFIHARVLVRPLQNADALELGFDARHDFLLRAFVLAGERADVRRNGAGTGAVNTEVIDIQLHSRALHERWVSPQTGTRRVPREACDHRPIY